METAVSQRRLTLEHVLTIHSEEEDPDEIPFQLTLKKKGTSGANSPAPLMGPNGAS